MFDFFSYLCIWLLWMHINIIHLFRAYFRDNLNLESSQKKVEVIKPLSREDDIL